MPQDLQKQRIAAFLRTLAVDYAEQIRHFEEGLVELCRELEIQKIVWSDLSLHNRLFTPRCGEPHCPIADGTTFAIVWQDKSCFLGSGLLFRFFEKIASRPGRYCSHKDLLDNVWGEGQVRARASIRNVAKRLRDKLTANDMQELAEAIDGSVVGNQGGYRKERDAFPLYPSTPTGSPSIVSRKMLHRLFPTFQDEREGFRNLQCPHNLQVKAENGGRLIRP